MELDIEEKKWQLADSEFKQNVNDVFGELSLCAEKTKNPEFVIVGGQAGSGKSMLVAKEYQNLVGNAIIIDQDELRTKFPREKYQQIHDMYTEREEFLILKPYISKVIVDIVDRATKEGYNIVLESALRSVNSFINTTQEVKVKGYNTKLSVIAVPEVEANLSMLTRYCYYLEKYGECRRNTRLDHSAVENVRKNIQRLDELEIFDDIIISKRGKNIDSLPIQSYSKKINKKMTPLQAYDMERKLAFDDTRENFVIRYEHIKSVLTKHAEFEQLEKLEEIRNAFEKEKNRREVMVHE